MCGIAGCVDFCEQAESALHARASAMAAAIARRGPDAQGVWVDARAGLALGHRRLSIIDPSPSGAQPMVSSSGRFIMAYNGEIFNAQDVRPALEAKGIRFRGHADTEVLLEACAAWGVEAAVKRFNGMFAFAVWDREEQKLTLARDRLGIKPLYWGKDAGGFFFASTLKALRACEGWNAIVNPQAVSAFLRFGYVPAPLSIYRDVQKLMPGTLVHLQAGRAPITHTYWSLEEVVQDGRRHPFEGSDAEAVDQLDRLLRDAVGRSMAADVPLGAFLSGGIDSSTVVALMQAQSTARVRTFSLGFDAPGYDEAPYAKAVAAHLGTAHTEFYVTPQEALDVVPRLPEMYDEPFADSSQIPTALVATLAGQHVKVALSGDGGDELFCGYTRYAYADKIKPYVTTMPPFARAALARAIQITPPSVWALAQKCVPARYRIAHAAQKMQKLARVLTQDEDAAYMAMLTHWAEPQALLPGVAVPPTLIGAAHVRALMPQLMERMQYVDTLTYLPDDILTKVDRASMDVSLEARVPLLDHRVAAFAWSLPSRLKMNKGVSKWVLRQVLGRYVPPALVERPKMGFGVPIDEWLRGPLRAWADDMLAPAALCATGLESALIQERWQAHQAGTNGASALWNVLMLQSWMHAHKMTISGSAVPALAA